MLHCDCLLLMEFLSLLWSSHPGRLVSGCTTEVPLEFIVTDGTVDLKDQGLSAVPNGIPNNISRLYLNNNEITSLENCTFCNFYDLKELRLLQNQIVSIDRTALQGTPLTDLALSYNCLTVFPDFSLSGDQLSFLSLSNNEISTVPEGHLTGLLSLSILLLSNNKLTRLPRLTDEMAATLTKLSLSRNQIAFISAEDLSTFRVLKRLQLSGNKLTAFPDFSQMPAASKLQYLEINWNEIANLTEEMLLPLGSLTYLFLNHNQLTSLPSLAPVGATLLTLTAQSNDISDLKETFFDNVTKLSRLNLTANCFTAVPDVTRVSSTLVWLELSDNKITNPPFTWFLGMVQEMPVLNTLSLGTELTTFPDVYHDVNSRIQTLDLKGNSFHCDCYLSWIVDATAAGMDIQLDAKPCSSPPALANRDGDTLTKQDLCPCPSYTNITSRRFEKQASGAVPTVGLLNTFTARSNRQCAVQCSNNYSCRTFSYNKNTRQCSHSDRWASVGEEAGFISQSETITYSELECSGYAEPCSRLNVSLSNCLWCDGLYFRQPDLIYHRPVYNLSNSSAIQRTLKFESTLCRWVIEDELGVLMYVSMGSTKACEPHSGTLSNTGEDFVNCLK